MQRSRAASTNDECARRRKASFRAFAATSRDRQYARMHRAQQRESQRRGSLLHCVRHECAATAQSRCHAEPGTAGGKMCVDSERTATGAMKRAGSVGPYTHLSGVSAVCCRGLLLSSLFVWLRCDRCSAPIFFVLAGTIVWDSRSTRAAVWLVTHLLLFCSDRSAPLPSPPSLRGASNHASTRWHDSWRPPAVAVVVRSVAGTAAALSVGRRELYKQCFRRL